MEMKIPELDDLSKRLDDMADIMVRLVATSKDGTLTVSVLDVARLEGVSPSQVYSGGSERYLLPRFGESAYPTGSVRWPLEEYLEWRRKDPKERYVAWRKHLVEQKDRRLGCREKSSGGSSSRRTGSGTA